MSTFNLKNTLFHNRSAIQIENDLIELVVLIGGGHLASVRLKSHEVSPLWVPPWNSYEPDQRKSLDRAEFDDNSECEVLSSIMGHNLCLDVFGAHSDGEIASGMTFHGEAGMLSWKVIEAKEKGDSFKTTLSVTLPHTLIRVDRSITLKKNETTIFVDEVITNLTGFERVYGAAQHVTLGKEFLENRDCQFACNADKGKTWPEVVDESDLAFALDTEFDYPMIPTRSGATQDWREYPRVESNSDLCTLHINPNDDLGWFTASSQCAGFAISYIWKREDYPWLMNWEENHYRENKPWNRRALTRGLEFSSYHMPLSRRQNVELGKVFDTPCFGWLDAYETKSIPFALSLKALPSGANESIELSAQNGSLHHERLDWTISLN